MDSKKVNPKKSFRPPPYLRETEDERFLQSTVAELQERGLFRGGKESWRVFRIMGEFVEGFDELFEALTLIQTQKVRNFPVVMFDTKYWAGLMDWIKDKPLEEGKISKEDLDLIVLTDSPEEEVAHVVSCQPETRR